MRWRGVLHGASLALALGACATVHNLPLNIPSATPFAGTLAQLAVSARNADRLRGVNGGDVIGLAFSGGGTRAAAFAYGVFKQLAATPSPRRGGQGDLLDHVVVVSGVSVGSIMAAYYGLKGRAALDDFRQNFLDQDLMASL